MKQRKVLNKKRGRRSLRVRARIFGTPKEPRLAVFRSNKSISAQLIDDEKGRTVAHASSKEISGAGGNKTEQAKKVGKLISTKAKEAGITRVVFDRRHYKYHGRVKALAEEARKTGLKI